MDVQLPDGTIIENVPEGTTKAQLMAKLRAGGYDVSKLEAPQESKPGLLGSIEEYISKPVAPAPANLQAQGYDPLAGYAERVAGNVPQDVLNIAQGFTPESMGALGSALYNQPIAALQGAGQFLAHPLETFANAPVSTAMGLQAAQMARMPTRVAANMVAEAVYPKLRAGLAPQNRMLLDVFGNPEIQASLQEAPAGYNVPQALADINAPRAQAVAKQALSMVPDETRAAQEAQAQARLEALSRIGKTPQELQAAEEARAAAGTANYREAFKAEAPQIPEEFFNRPTVKAANKVADAIEAETGRAAAPMERLHNIKTGLDDVVRNPTDHGFPGLTQAMKNTRAEFLEYLNTVPEYARARTCRRGLRPP